MARAIIIEEERSKAEDWVTRLRTLFPGLRVQSIGEGVTEGVCILYLLSPKPVDCLVWKADFMPPPKELQGISLSPYDRLQEKNISNVEACRLRERQIPASTRRKTRILVKRGEEHLLLLLADIVFFFSEQKVVFAFDKTGQKYMLDKKLIDLEKELDEKIFFRANRQYIVHMAYIKSFRAYERVKLWVTLSLPMPDHTIIISQETAPNFRKWML